MAGTLFFVHGTGVRDEGYKASLDLITEGIKRTTVGLDEVRGISWGTEFGVKLDRLAEVLPVVPTKAAAPAPTADEITAAVWAQLIEDPLFELRIAAVRPPATPTTAGLPQQEFPGDKVAAKLKALSLTDTDVEGTGLTAVEVKRAADWLATMPELAGAAQSFGDANDGDLNQAVARSLVASIISQHHYDAPGTAPAVVIDGTVRDRLVSIVANKLTPAPTKAFIADWLKHKAEEIAKARATSFLRERRTGVTGASLPGIGDILFYQRRGQKILDRIDTEIKACTPPVLALGHSLGGIMLVDLLSRSASPKVKLLVTAGSQSPLFYIIDSLETLQPGGTAKPFVPWLNIYDPNDFLSFRAEAVFPGRPDVRDEMVNSKVPFPDSHSAYWRQDDVFRLIETAWST
jgi:hypothetical protein